MIVALSLCSAAVLSFASGDYKIAPAAGNRFTLEVEKTGIMRGKKHTFSFPAYSGTLHYDPRIPERSSVEFTLDANSMICEDTWVKDDDRKKILEWGLNRMIDVREYPRITFVSKKITASGPQAYAVEGSLTMRGTARPAAVALTARQIGQKLEVEGASQINMRDWGMKPPTAALGAVGTKPEMIVHFLISVAPPQ